MPRVVALAGGTGAAKLLRGLVACTDPAQLTIIGNTGDDTEHWGLHVCPDLDTIMYALAGVLDVGRGWGRANETFQCLGVMGAYGAETWFNLGDRDLATHLVRTAALRAGRPLSAVTATLAAALGVRAQLLPMSDDRVRTSVRTTRGWLTFQEYFVRDKALPEPLDVRYEGAERARPAPGTLEAIAHADVIAVCPSNPVTSIGPILAVPGVTDALGSSRGRVVGVSPIVGGAALSGPAAALMRMRRWPVSAGGVARAYRPWLDRLLIDTGDAGAAAEVKATGAAAALASIVMTDRAAEIALARRVLEEGS